MAKVRKAFFTLRDVCEITIPCLAFSLLFIAFIWQVITRYILDEPISWPMEVQACGYIWTVLLGACYARRFNRHVAFTVVYDILPSHLQRCMRLFGNLVIAGTYSILLPYSIEYVFSVAASTPVFRVPLTIAFLPMVFFVLAAILYALSDVWFDVHAIAKGEPSREPRVMIQPQVETNQQGEAQ